MIPVKGCVKNYHWGKTGEDSFIARFEEVAPRSPQSIKSLSSGISQSPRRQQHGSSPLAELWFGSHPSGPATLSIGQHRIRLNDFFKKQPEMIGVIDQYVKYNKQLPFLFKILSVAQPLSLQAHPDKRLAQFLHKHDPKNYPDANHKPELAIALTDFEVLCDFRPYAEIEHFMANLAPLRRIVGEKNLQIFHEAIRQQPQQHKITRTDSNHNASDATLANLALGACFKSLMTTDPETIKRETRCLFNECSALMGKDLSNVIADMERIYPGDPGIFAPFFLNYLRLAPGQAIYLQANKLHAYLKGECIECMACSDNVVRAGLTSKFRDVQTLINMLNYEPVDSVHDLILTPKTKQQSKTATITAFEPSEEFKVEKIVLCPTTSDCEFTLPSVSSGSFVIVMNGKAEARDFIDISIEHKLKFGFAGFVPPKMPLHLYNIQGTLIMYRAFC